MLTRLKIQNYRCLQDIDIPFNDLTALVGPNGSGKTSILRALSCLFGEAWPSVRSFRIPQDFAQFDTRRPIEITGWFTPAFVHEDALKKKHEIVAVRLSCRPYKSSGRWGEAGDLHADLEPLNAKGEVPVVATTPPKKGSPPSFRPLSATGDLREYTKLLFVDHRRSLAQHLPTIRGSILGRLLEPARRNFSRQDDFKSAYEAALDILRTDTVREIEEKIRETAKRMLGFLGREASKALDIGLGFADPANPFNSLRLEYRESGRGFPGDELGLGIQSAVVVGIFEAFRQIGGGIQSVVIEEPEMYLHPQAQRYFYRLLCEMGETNSSQVIYATHSPIFADVNKFEGLRLVRREPNKSSILSYVRPEDFKTLSDERERQKLAGRFDPTRNEVLFASRALVVEGHGDRHDDDLWPVEKAEDKAKQEEENRLAETDNRRIADAVGKDGSLFVAKPTLEAMLGIGRSAKDKPLKIVEKLRDMKLSDVPQPLMDAVKAVLPPDERSSGTQ